MIRYPNFSKIATILHGCMYPQRENVDNICNSYGNPWFLNLFGDIMNKYGSKNCSCHPECSETSYDLHVAKEPFNVRKNVIQSKRQMSLFVILKSFRLLLILQGL